MGSAIWKVPLLPHTLSRGQCFTWNVGAWRFGVGEACLWEAGLFRSFWFYGDVVVSRGTWAMLVKEIFCDCSHVSWCLKVSRCFTWNTTFLQQPNCFTWNVGCFCCRGVFWVLVFLVGGGCFTWNMGNACNEIPRVYGRACRRCWIVSRIFLKFIQFVLADGCVVFVWVSVELLGACHSDLCFPGSFSMFHVKRKFGGCGMWE